jgi:hypothetical protein
VTILLGCFLLLAMGGLAYAQETQMTLTTDKGTYRPRDTVYVTVTAPYSNNGCAVAFQVYVLCLSIVIIPLPAPACSYSCPTASATLLLLPPARYSAGYVEGYQGKVALQLPADTPAGNYEVGMLTCPNWVMNGNSITCGSQFIFSQLPTIEITVAGRTAPDRNQG